MNRREKSNNRKVLILLENNAFPEDRRVFNQIEALQSAGYSVSVICPQGDAPELKALRETVAGVKVYRYPMLGQGGGKLGYVLEYLCALILTSIWSLVVWICDDFDTIHSANPPDIFFLIAWPFKLLGKKYVYDEHDLCPELYDSKFQRKGFVYRVLLALQKQSYRAADLVISTNESYRQIAKIRGNVSDERLAIVRNGVDIKVWHRRTARAELKRGFPHLAVYLGVMGTQDGVDRVIYAADYVINKLGRRDVLFVLVGKGECWRALQELSRSLKLEDFVQFVGRIPDDLLLDYLSTSDVCLAPDPPDEMNQLSTMTKIMEYMACGNPIVSFDLLETRRSAGEAAVYVQGSDPRMLGAALVHLLDDPSLRKRMAQVGVDRSINLVGLDRSRKALIEAYSRLHGEVTTSSGADAVLPETVNIG
jgi:glycosyltransferase involved in cell wall biosynthesis